MAKHTKKSQGTVMKLWERLQAGEFRALNERTISDDEAKALADIIGEESSYGDVFHLIEALPVFDKTYDWNVGSLLQHLDGELTVSAIQHAGDRKTLYESAGLAWALGQFRGRGKFVVEFLRAAVREAQNPEAWWQAAFSLERLGVDDAVNLLKRTLKQERLGTLESYLRCLDNKRSLIAILLLADERTQEKAYPVLKKAVLSSRDPRVLANVCWLIGRLRVADADIAKRLVTLTGHADYDCRYYAFFALVNNPGEHFYDLCEGFLWKGDAMARKMAARGLRSLGDEKALVQLESALDRETDPSVVFELTKSVSRLKNVSQRNASALKRKGSRFENGKILAADLDPSKFNLFAEARDPESTCFGIISRRLKQRKVVNPIDVMTGSGRAMRQLFENVPYSGTLFGVDPSKKMCEFADASIRRERNFMSKVEVVTGTAQSFVKDRKVKSSCIINAFGFSKMAKDREALIKELQAIHGMMTDDGEFYTIGWDELYNDAFGTIWFKFVPDAVQARNYDEWREAKMRTSHSRSSIGLNWLRRGIYAPMQFRSMDETVRVMGYLFGRDAVQYVIRNGRTEWSMSLGITCDTKESLKSVIDRLRSE